MTEVAMAERVLNELMNQLGELRSTISHYKEERQAIIDAIPIKTGMLTERVKQLVSGDGRDELRTTVLSYRDEDAKLRAQINEMQGQINALAKNNAELGESYVKLRGEALRVVEERDGLQQHVRDLVASGGSQSALAPQASAPSAASSVATDFEALRLKVEENNARLTKWMNDHTYASGPKTKDQEDEMRKHAMNGQAIARTLAPTARELKEAPPGAILTGLMQKNEMGDWDRARFVGGQLAYVWSDKLQGWIQVVVQMRGTTDDVVPEYGSAEELRAARAGT